MDTALYSLQQVAAAACSIAHLLAGSLTQSLAHLLARSLPYSLTHLPALRHYRRTHPLTQSITVDPAGCPDCATATCLVAAPPLF